MKHTVHLYAVVIAKVVNVEASSDKEAVEKAFAACAVDLYKIIDAEAKDGFDYMHVKSLSYGEEILGGLVDHEDDPEYAKTSYVQLLPDAGIDRYKSEVKVE